MVAAAIRLDLGAPVFIRPLRPGLNGRTFRVLKFRTMNDNRDPQGRLLPDAARLTRLGRFIRSASIDELPQLWNVLRGDMSLVGPRPLLMEYLDRYTPEQARRHEVRPGITGWAQIAGRKDVPFSRRLDLDVWYVDHASLGLDLRIMLLTLVKVLRTTGARPDQEVSEVDDIGLHPDTRPMPRSAERESKE
jgi:lipopolysaccharide/colanic/teichoic acid biosynthesis glycosyltransferase